MLFSKVEHFNLRNWSDEKMVTEIVHVEYLVNMSYIVKAIVVPFLNNFLPSYIYCISEGYIRSDMYSYHN